ncbi:hypothetical protein HanPI659440_Chr14g0525431 [Helianthus annuus]|nr:hypothetical protein HanPI659440_Chr14g0525431 [Helianthus annuus]
MCLDCGVWWGGGWAWLGHLLTRGLGWQTWGDPHLNRVWWGGGWS